MEATPEGRRHLDTLLAHLFAADRHDHLYHPTEGIAARTAHGEIALSTRYYFSSLAYNARESRDQNLVRALNAVFPLPEIIIYLRVPIEVSLGRLSRRSVRELYEREEELRRVAQAFEGVLAPHADRLIVEDTTADQDEVADRIADQVLRRLALRTGG